MKPSVFSIKDDRMNGARNQLATH